ncbi:MAG TPA: mersacidin/lichenicidin family type 2 lantibiotic [Nocardioidaceae bacterium]|nr:mersacidin/lichenicidin family type 2 lantibiotic [Nocardioidaceae bacterium]
MSKHEVIRAWEDPDSMGAGLQGNPAGAIELSDNELGQVRGAAQSGSSVGCNTKTCVHTRGNSNNPCSSC